MASIPAEEYQKFIALREQIEKGVEEAESEFMLTTYTKLFSVIGKRAKIAENLNIQLKNQGVRGTAKEKRDALKKKNQE